MKNTNGWKLQLNNLLNFYSAGELAILLNLNNGYCIHRLKYKKRISKEFQIIINDIYSKVSHKNYKHILIKTKIQKLLEEKYPIIIRAIRKESGLTVYEIASWLGVCVSAIIQRETCSLKLTFPYYEKIKKAINNNTKTDTLALEKKYIKILSSTKGADLVVELYWKVFKNFWKHYLSELKEIYDDSQLATLFDVHSATTAWSIRNLKETPEQNLKKKIFKIYIRLLRKEDPRKILFESWRQRFRDNKYGILCRLIRNELRIPMKRIATQLNTTETRLTAQETCTIKMTPKRYQKIMDVIRSISNCNLNSLENKFAQIFDNSLLTQQPFIFIHSECPAVVKLYPPTSLTRGTKIERKLFRAFRHNFEKVFWGAKLLPKQNLRQSEIGIDILIINHNQVIGVDVKSKLNMKNIFQYLVFLNAKFNTIKKNIPEIDKLVTILPYNKISDSIKAKFRGSDNFLFDSVDFKKIEKNPSLLAKLPQKHPKKTETQDNLFCLKEQWKLSPAQMVVLLEDLGYKFETNGKKLSLRGKVTKIYRIFAPRVVLMKEGRNPNSYINGYILNYLRKLEEEIKKLGLREIHRKANILLATKYNRGKKRSDWSILKEFPMVCNLNYKVNNKFEEFIENHYKSKKCLTLRNVCIDTSTLSNTVSTGRYPEVDILAKKNGKFIAISCKVENSNPTYAGQRIKRTVDNLKLVSGKIGFNKLILAVTFMGSEISKNNLRNYATRAGIDLQFFNSCSDPLCIKIRKVYYEKCKILLYKLNLFDDSYEIVKENEYLYLPLNRKPNEEEWKKLTKLVKQISLTNKILPSLPKVRSLRDILKNKLSMKELKLVPSSYDIIGSKQKAVAIIDLSEELKTKEKLIAKAIMHVHKNVKSVLEKVSERKGKLRLREHELILGDRNTKVLHKEYGCLFKLDPKKVYFSPREATERQRIAKQVKENENVLVMFSGISPFSIIIAKNQPRVKKIYSIELNPIAHKYAVENIKINKLENKIIPILGDVCEICPKLKEKFDRIVMPLPKEAYKYLPIAINCLKNKGMLHFYYWSAEQDLFSAPEKLIKKECEKFRKKLKIINKRKVLPYGPRTFKVCIDCVI